MRKKAALKGQTEKAGQQPLICYHCICSCWHHCLTLYNALGPFNCSENFHLLKTPFSYSLDKEIAGYKTRLHDTKHESSNMCMHTTSNRQKSAISKLKLQPPSSRLASRLGASLHATSLRMHSSPGRSVPSEARPVLQLLGWPADQAPSRPECHLLLLCGCLRGPPAGAVPSATGLF